MKGFGLTPFRCLDNDVTPIIHFHFPFSFSKICLLLQKHQALTYTEWQENIAEYNDWYENIKGGVTSPTPSGNFVNGSDIRYSPKLKV